MLYLYALLLVLLFFAAFIDAREHRIPNCVVALLILLGFAGRLFLEPLAAFSFSILGFLAGLLPMLAMHFLTGIGAGDVKLLAAIGTITGAQSVLLIFGYSFLISGLWAWGLIFFRGGGMDIVNRYARFFAGLSQGHLNLEKPCADSIAASELPLAPGIAIATVYVLLPDVMQLLSCRQF